MATPSRAVENGQPDRRAPAAAAPRPQPGGPVHQVRRARVPPDGSLALRWALAWPGRGRGREARRPRAPPLRLRRAGAWGGRVRWALQDPSLGAGPASKPRSAGPIQRVPMPTRVHRTPRGPPRSAPPDGLSGAEPQAEALQPRCQAAAAAAPTCPCRPVLKASGGPRGPHVRWSPADSGRGLRGWGRASGGQRSH